MAKVKIQGHASGTGILTVTAPDTDENRTITLPDATGTLLNSDGDGSSLTGINGSAFKALAVSASFSAVTATKVQFSDEQFDVNGDYDSATNYRFTPTVAGYYHFDITLDVRGTASLYQSTVYLYKNGSSLGYGSKKSDEVPHWISFSTLEPANGTSDYFEVYVYSSLTSPSYEESSDGDCTFSAHWARSL